MEPRGKRFQDKVALITGGNSGIGLAVAEAFVSEGARVFVVGRDPSTLQAAREKLGPRAKAIRADVSKTSEIDRMLAEVDAASIDVLFVNAGVNKIGLLETVTEETFDSVMGVNARGAYFTVQRTVRRMARGGAIVLNASVDATHGGANSSVYAASKAALRSLGRTLSVELAVSRGIRLNVVSPGPTDTPVWMRDDAVEHVVETFKKQIATQVPLKRLGTPAEIASAVLYLASSEAAFIVGAELRVDGGFARL
jgi:NAD(P)-dependent dehydrogenase (short-subunit alcohol dehydrogenase family)